MTYTMTKKTPFRFPTERYLNIVKRGYKDCKLDKKYFQLMQNFIVYKMKFGIVIWMIFVHQT